MRVRSPFVENSIWFHGGGARSTRYPRTFSMYSALDLFATKEVTSSAFRTTDNLVYMHAQTDRCWTARPVSSPNKRRSCDSDLNGGASFHGMCMANNSNNHNNKYNYKTSTKRRTNKNITFLVMMPPGPAAALSYPGTSVSPCCQR